MTTKYDSDIRFRNVSGNKIPRGAPVMLESAVGQHGLLTGVLMDSSDTANAEKYLGLATADVVDGAEGRIRAFGDIRAADTSAWQDGDLLYCDPQTPGAMTATKPTTGAILPVAFVSRAHADQGVLQVKAAQVVEAAGADATAVTRDASGSIVLGDDAGSGIKVDVEAPVFGWRDLIGDISVRGLGAADPTYAVYGTTPLRGFQFSATTMQEVFIVYHVPHDWVPGTDIFFHAHWSNAAATPSTGDVVWKFDYSFAEGFDQAEFPAVSTVSVTQTCPATQYRHMVAETTGVSIPSMEVDGLLLVRVYRDAANVADTCTDPVFLHTADIHYQSTNMATVNKAPSFYGP